jgi:hypothetical protein
LTHALIPPPQIYRYKYTKHEDKSFRTGQLEQFVAHHLSQEPEASDIVHDLLAYLAEEMLRLNKLKREKQREFLSELVKTLNIQPQPDPKTGKVGLDALKYKDKLQDYPGDYQKGERELTSEALIAILLDRDNQKRYLLASTEVQRRLPLIRERYQQSLTEVLPLKGQLAATDTLIDRIVYKLYGLTDEEIKVVEG